MCIARLDVPLDDLGRLARLRHRERRLVGAESRDGEEWDRRERDPQEPATAHFGLLAAAEGRPEAAACKNSYYGKSRSMTLRFGRGFAEGMANRPSTDGSETSRPDSRFRRSWRARSRPDRS